MDTKIDIFIKYLEIKKDLISNLQDVTNRQNYYSKKYRGNFFTDINVSIGLAENGIDQAIQIFIKHKGLFIKENIVYNSQGLFESVIKSNLHE